MRRATGRRGFALMMTLAHLALLLAVWGLANRQTAALLDLETALGHRSQREQGSLVALARGLALLETGLPPKNPYSCSTVVRGTTYTVTFQYSPSGTEGNQWTATVSAAPTTGTPPVEMLTSFPGDP
jgi:hypothetical protein